MTYTESLNRQKRQRQTQDTWRKWTRRNRVTTTRVPEEETITVDLPDWVSPFATERPRWTREYRTTPRPIFIQRYTDRPRTSRPGRRMTQEPTDLYKMPTREPYVTQSLYKPWNPVTVPPPIPAKHTTRKTTLPETTMSTTPEPTVGTKSLRVKPGTILLMDSEYLKQKYITTGLATTFHRAVLAEYFGLSESDMIDIGMTVVAWGFSYQVKDKATSALGRNRAPKYFCDFKFRSSTFNAGYVGAKINMGITKLDG